MAQHARLLLYEYCTKVEYESFLNSTDTVVSKWNRMVEKARVITRNEFTINKFWLTVNSTFYGVALTGISISVFFSLFYRFH